MTGKSLGTRWRILFTHKVGKAAAQFAKDVFSKKLVVLLIVILAALMMHALRNLFYKNVPWVIKHSTAFTATLNVVTLAFYEVIVTIKLIVMAIKEMLFVVTLGHYPHKVPTIKNIPYPPVFNASMFRQTIKTAATACNTVKSGWATSDTFVKFKTSPKICPLIRATAPMGKFGNIIESIGKPLSYDPNPQGNNCSPGDWNEAVVITCLVINSGAVLMQVIMPLMIILFFARRFALVAAEAAWLSIVSALSLTNTIVKQIAKRLV